MRRLGLLLALVALLAACGGEDGSSIGGPPGSAIYTGAVRDGTARLAIDPAWDRSGTDIALWRVASDPDGTPATLELQLEHLTDIVPLARYVDVSVDRVTGQVPGLRLVSREDVVLASGLPATRLVLATDEPPARRFLVLVTVRETAAASIVVIASAARFDEVVRTVEPYARTLRFI